MLDCNPASDIHNRYLGCLAGGAVGDALGSPVEFLTREQILCQFGPQGVTRPESAYGGVGLITDDTQMSLFTAEGLLRAWARDGLRGLMTVPSIVAHAYLRWLITQGEQPAADVELPEADAPGGWLFNDLRFHHRRAPGNTCLAALRDMQWFGEPACNDSKGCGGVMRVAPVGLFMRQAGGRSPDDAFAVAADVAALTHGHPTGFLTAGVLAVLVWRLTEGGPLAQALAEAKVLLRRRDHHEETLAAIEEAEQLAESKLPAAEAIEHLGGGWVAEEALAIAIYCALTARNFASGVLMAVNHGGDSDSTGAITGNLLGATHGLQGIPILWLSVLEMQDVICQVADDLYRFPAWKPAAGGDAAPAIWQRYPGY